MSTRRRGCKPFLPSAITGSVRSLPNKLDELHACVQYQQSFRMCIVCGLLRLGFMISFLTRMYASTASRCSEQTDRKKLVKSRRRSACLYEQAVVQPQQHVPTFTQCTPDAEILTVSAPPYYLPREFSHVVVVTVYVPPSACAREAAKRIVDHVHDLDTRSPDTIKIVTGDFNHCEISKMLPGYQQQVECTTRGQRRLDLFYCNARDARDACTSASLPPLGRSDRNLVSLLPKYRPRVQREPLQTRSVQVWSAASQDTFKGCFECTDWSVFEDTASSVSELADTVCSLCRKRDTQETGQDLFAQ